MVLVQKELKNAYIWSTPVKRATIRVNGTEKQVRPSGWQPWANTIARWKLDWNTSDSTNNWYDLTVKTGSITYWDLSWWTKYWIFNGSTVLTKTSVPSWTKWTLSLWTNKLSTSELVPFAQSTNTNWSEYYVQLYLTSNNIWIWTWDYAQHHQFSYTQNTNQWYNIVLTQDWTSMKLYVNGTLYLDEVYLV